MHTDLITRARSSRIARGTAVLAGAALLSGLVVSAPAAAAPAVRQQSSATTAADRQDTATEQHNACIVRTLLTQTFTDPASRSSRQLAARLVSSTAVTHGAGTATGPKGLLSQFSADRTRVPGAQAVIKHLAADGDLVAVHWQIAPDPRDERRGDAAVDLFRLQHGRVVEHWSLEQSIPTGTPASGNTNTMFSDLYRPARPTSAPTERREERNRILAVSAYDTLFRDHDASILDRAFDPAYLQHNSVAPNGTAALKQLFGSGAQFPAQQSVISLSDGDIVWTFSQAVGAKPGDPLLAADLFRVDGGLIREHWDVVPTN
ncbi:nuclear transport factor 2 family protein [Curtobacterium sp. VKM Ac-1393]|uniref:nuclear transport factor 2 family protein n=1 Tax=Curtobacterium sp. VKM Ac-1393 TaxID=2783814 RepID=UPI00188B0A2D|nr:nuclear transport factor 2 family protein [Curtobacterium sp. VKM Ac-1393]MBF4606533.1 nuclear transport factor 2 family protein [Curtobacterium sp. VKM Ac-1393]